MTKRIAFKKKIYYNVHIDEVRQNKNKKKKKKGMDLKMRKSIKKIAATMLAATMVFGTFTTAFGFTTEEVKNDDGSTSQVISDLDEGESIYLLAGNATGWSTTNPDAVLTAVEGKEGVLKFDVTLLNKEAGEWERRFSIIGNYYDGENYVQGGWTRMLIGEPNYRPSDTYTCLTTICVDDLEADTAATVLYDTRTATIAIVDAEGKEIPYTMIWVSNDRDEGKVVEGQEWKAGYTLEELAAMNYDDFVASLSADRQADIAAIGAEIELTKSVFSTTYAENVAGLVNYYVTGEDYVVVPEDPKPADPKPEDPKPEDPKPADPKPADPTTETTTTAAATTTAANQATKTGDVAPVALMVTLFAAVAVVAVVAKKKEA